MQPVQLSRALKFLSMRPRACIVLAALLVLLGAVFLSGWVPTSYNRPYFPGHKWITAAFCIGLAGFFAYCAAVGLRNQDKGDGK